MNPPKPHDLSQRKLRLIKSQKYLSNLPQAQPTQKEHSVEINTRFTQLRMLTKQKDKLMNQLNSLKEGALTALQEKEEIIDRLKNQTMRHMYFEDQKEQMQKQLNKYIRKFKEVLEEKNQIAEKYQKQRIFFFEQLYNKQAIIDQLSNRISNLHVELDNSNQNIKNLQGQLYESERATDKMRYQITQLKQQIRQYYRKTQSKDHHFNIEHYLCYKCLQNSPQSSPLIKRPSNQIIHDIQQLKLQHEEEMQETINFYESQLKIMRSFCEKEIGEYGGGLRKTLETQMCSDHEQNQSVNQLASLLSIGNSQRNGHKSRLVYNLKSQLKLMKHNDNVADDQRSQFTNNYFMYEHKNYPKDNRDSLEGTKNIKIQDNLTIITQESRKQEKNTSGLKPTKKQILWCLGGSFIGIISTISLMKLLSTFKK